MNIMVDQPWMKLEQDNNGEAYVAMKDDAVMIIAMTINHEILFIEEKSIAYQIPALTLPTGGVERNELPEITAERELQEEVGYRAETLTYIGTLHPSIKYMQWQCHIYVANNLIHSERDGDETTPVTVRPIALEDIDKAIISKQITDSTTIAAIYLARQYIS